MLRICLIFTIIFLNLSNFSLAKDENFYFENNIYVFETADSPTVARNKAFISARKKGLDKIFEKLNIKPIVLAKITDNQISQMVKSEQVKQEVIDKNSYSATFSIEYDQNAINYFLNKGRAKSGGNYLLIPIKKTDYNSYILWEAQNDWKMKISENIDKYSAENNNNINFIIPDGDIENISTFNAYNISDMTYKDFEPTLAKYNSLGVYTIFYTNDKIENKVSIDVFFIGNLQKKHVKLNFLNSRKLSYESLLNIVSKKTAQYLLSDKSAKLREEINNSKQITFFKLDLEKILEIKNRIENSGLTKAVSIKSASHDETVIIVNYDSKVSIEEAFLSIGFNLVKKEDGHYINNQ